MLRRLFVLALLVFAVGFGEAAEPGKVSVFVGAGQARADFLALKQRVIPTPQRPLYYVPEHRRKDGVAAPPEWIVMWMASYLADKGYVAADGFTPPLRLVFTWGAIDPQVTHIGRPAQRVDPAGRKLLHWRETNYDLGRTTPFCVVSAFDAETPKSQRKDGAIWESELWMVLVRPRPKDEVHVGTPEVVGDGRVGETVSPGKK